MKPQKYRCALLVMVLLVAWRHECYAGADDQPSEQSGSNCQNSFYEDRDSVLLARHLGSLFDSKTALKHLRQITGLLPIIEQHCIRDRCTEPNKDFFRAFLIEYLKGLGYSGQDIKFEYQGKVLSYGELLARSTALRNKEFSHPRLTKPGPKKAKKSKRADIGSLSDLIAKTISFFDVDLPESSGGGDHERIPILPKAVQDWLLLKQALIEMTAGVSKKRAKAGPINIIAEKLGTDLPQEFVEVNAHYDTVFKDVPGADDNGSGTVTLLEAARLVRAMTSKRSVRILFADLEEKGFQGTTMHAEILSKSAEIFIGAIVIDMFGFYPHKQDEKKVFVIEAADKSEFSDSTQFERNRLFVNAILDQASLFDRHAKPRLSVEDSKPWSADHGPYWNKDLPSVLVAAEYSEDYINPGYHSLGDTIRFYDWIFYRSIAAQIIESLARVAGISRIEGFVGTDVAKLDVGEDARKAKDWLGAEIMLIEERAEEKKLKWQKAWEKKREEEWEKEWTEESTSSIPVLGSQKSQSSQSEDELLKRLEHDGRMLRAQQFSDLMGIDSSEFGKRSPLIEGLVGAGFVQPSPDNHLIPWYVTGEFYFPEDSQLDIPKAGQYAEFLDHTIGVGAYFDDVLIRIGRYVLRKSSAMGEWTWDVYRPSRESERGMLWMIYERPSQVVYQELGPKIVTWLYEDKGEDSLLDNAYYIQSKFYTFLKHLEFPSLRDGPKADVLNKETNNLLLKYLLKKEVDREFYKNSGMAIIDVPLNSDILISRISI